MRTNLEIVEILKLYNGANDIESYAFLLMDRIDHLYTLVDDRLVKKNNK